MRDQERRGAQISLKYLIKPTSRTWYRLLTWTILTEALLIYDNIKSCFNKFNLYLQNGRLRNSRDS